MVATVGSIAIDLSTNVAKFASGFKSAATTVDRESNRMAKSIATVDRASKAAGGVLSGFVGGIVAGGALAAFSSLSGAITKTTQALADFEEIGNRAKTVGLRNDTFQAISFGALQADVSQEKLNSSLEIFAKNMGLAKNGTGALYSGLKKLNPELLSSLRSTTDQEQRLEKVAAAFNNTSDATKRAALATTIFGKGGIEMVRVLEGGSRAIDNLKEKARGLGVIIPDDLIEKAGELDDKLATLGKVIDINISQALVNAAPFLVATAEGLAAMAKEINATSAELTKFSENPGLDSLQRLADYFFDVEIKGGILGAIRDSLTHDAPTIIKEINTIEEEIKELQETGAGGAGIVIEQDLRRLEVLRAELEEFRSEAIIASENAARSAHQWLASASSPTAPGTQANGDLPTVTAYERTTADNTERTADAVEDQTVRQSGYFTDLEATLKNDVTGGITKYIQQLIYAQELAATSISDAVRTGFLTGNDARDRDQYTISRNDPLADFMERQSLAREQAMQTGEPVTSSVLSGQSALWDSIIGGRGITYAGAFADGGTVTNGNQSGDTTRMLMDVNAGEKVTVSKGNGSQVTLNFYAAQGENEATMRQRARQAGEVISRQLARA
jgi:hypothetical protein